MGNNIGKNKLNNQLNNNQKVITKEKAKDNKLKVYNQVIRLNLTFLSLYT